MYRIQSYSCLLLLTLLLSACQEPDRGPEKRPAPIVPTHWRDGTPIAADYPRDHYGVPYSIGNLGGQFLFPREVRRCFFQAARITH